MEYSPTSCFAGFKKKRQFQQEKEKNWPRKKCRDIVFLCHDIISKEPVEAMSQQAELCRNKDQAELKPETKIAVTPHNFFAALIKENGSGTLSRHFTTLSQHKELKIAENLCHDKRQLCRDTKFTVSIEMQEDFVATEKFYVATDTT